MRCRCTCRARPPGPHQDLTSDRTEPVTCLFEMSNPRHAAGQQARWDDFTLLGSRGDDLVTMHPRQLHILPAGDRRWMSEFSCLGSCLRENLAVLSETQGGCTDQQAKSFHRGQERLLLAVTTHRLAVPAVTWRTPSRCHFGRLTGWVLLTELAASIPAAAPCDALPLSDKLLLVQAGSLNRVCLVRTIILLQGSVPHKASSSCEQTLKWMAGAPPPPPPFSLSFWACKRNSGSTRDAAEP